MELVGLFGFDCHPCVILSYYENNLSVNLSQRESRNDLMVSKCERIILACS